MRCVRPGDDPRNRPLRFAPRQGTSPRHRPLTGPEARSPSHIVPGRGSGFSLEAPEGDRFLIRSRLFTEEELAAAEA